MRTVIWYSLTWLTMVLVISIARASGISDSNSWTNELMTSSSQKGMEANHQAATRASKSTEHAKYAEHMGHVYNSTEPETPPGLPPIKIPKTDHFWPSFLTAFVMILVSELGDKTFLTVAILAMRHSRLAIFTAGTMALALMTIVSCTFGLILPRLIPRRWTVWFASALFTLFGVKMLFDGWRMSAAQLREEYDELAHEIEDSDDASRRRTSPRPSSRLELGEADEEGCHRSLNRALGQLLACFSALRLSRFLSPVVIQAFSLTFLAEWGDRSQIATIALAAAQVHEPFFIIIIIGIECLWGGIRCNPWTRILYGPGSHQWSSPRQCTIHKDCNNRWRYPIYRLCWTCPILNKYEHH